MNRTPNSQKMFEATTKKSFLLTDIDMTCDVLEEAVNLAFEGQPGPVHIHVPEDLTHPSERVKNYHDIRIDVTPVEPDAAKVEEISSALADAFRRGRKIVALVGFGAIRSQAGAEVRRFIERFQIPLLTTLDGKGIVSEGHPLSVGVFCDSGHSSAWKAFREADVVLAIGNAFNQHATFDYHEDLFTDKTLIHVNISEREIDKAYKADHALVSDARAAVTAIHDALDARDPRGRLPGRPTPRRDAARVRGGADVGTANRDRREDHSMGPTSLQHFSGGSHPGPLGDIGREVASWVESARTQSLTAPVTASRPTALHHRARALPVTTRVCATGCPPASDIGPTAGPRRTGRAGDGAAHSRSRRRRTSVS